MVAGIWILGGALAMEAGGGPLRRVYQISGMVEQVSETEIGVRQGSEILWFEKQEEPPQTDEALESMKPGDSVTIWYKTQVLRTRVEKKSRQQPGTRAPKKGVLDDRAFYHARGKRITNRVLA